MIYTIEINEFGRQDGFEGICYIVYDGHGTGCNWSYMLIV